MIYINCLARDKAVILGMFIWFFLLLLLFSRSSKTARWHLVICQQRAVFANHCGLL